MSCEKNIKAIFKEDRVIGVSVTATGQNIQDMIAMLLAGIPADYRSDFIDFLHSIKDIEDKNDFYSVYYEDYLLENLDPEELLKELENSLGEVISNIRLKDNT